jgi:pyrrolidone-carboxylate peptidase
LLTGVLVTGFEPFGAHEVNPSQLLAQELDGVVLPVSYAHAADVLRAARTIGATSSSRA